MSSCVVGKPEALRQLEGIVHPLVAARRAELIADAGKKGVRTVILDNALLFETGGDQECDIVVVVTAGPEAQRERVLARPGMTAGEKDWLVRSPSVPDCDHRAQIECSPKRQPSPRQRNLRPFSGGRCQMPTGAKRPTLSLTR